MSNFVRIEDLFEPSVPFSVVESTGDGGSIIGKVRGQFFVPDGYSRNNRYYPKSLWNNVLSSDEVKAKLENRRMIGTIGHNSPIDDITILEGKISHVITKLWIEDNKGMGEAEILNTPAGRILKTMLEAGVRLYVSSRAYGKYKGNDPTGEYPALDPDNYKLETFDFVYDPGFLQTNPELVERLGEDFSSCGLLDINRSKFKSDKEVNNMNEKQLVESLLKDKQMLSEELEKITNEYNDLHNKYVVLEKQYEEKSSKCEELEKKVDELDELKKKVEEFNDLKKKYEDLEKKYNEEQKAFEESKERISKLEDFESRVGTLDEVEEVMDIVKSYFENYVADMEKEQAEKLASTYGVKDDVIFKLREKNMSFDEIEEILKITCESVSINSKYKVNTDSNNNDNNNDEPIKFNRFARLAESLSR